MTDPLQQSADTPDFNPEEAARTVTDAHRRISDEVHKVIVGQDDVLDELLVALFCGGHALVMGVPGLAKTLLISTVARTLSLGFSRIQSRAASLTRLTVSPGLPESPMIQIDSMSL